MDETLQTSEKIAEIYQPNNTVEYVAVMLVIAFALYLLSKYMMTKKEDKPSNDINESIKELKEYLKEEIKEIKESIEKIADIQTDNGKKLARDYTRLNESEKKFETLFDNMNSSNKELSELKGRLA